MTEAEALIPEAFTGGTLDLAALKRVLGEAAAIESGERYARVSSSPACEG